MQVPRHQTDVTLGVIRTPGYEGAKEDVMDDCGHPNHGAADHDCRPFVSSKAEREYAAYLARWHEVNDPPERPIVSAERKS
jgi:hypothetical protein